MRPLDRAVALPAWARAFARTVTGGRAVPKVTYGAATARALGEARVTGASWAGNVHLRRAPQETPRDLETLAHELTHAVTEPNAARFFEGAASDPGESEARALGRAVRTIARSAGTGPGLADRAAALLGQAAPRPASSPVARQARAIERARGSEGISGSATAGTMAPARRGASAASPVRRLIQRAPSTTGRTLPTGAANLGGAVRPGAAHTIVQRFPADLPLPRVGSLPVLGPASRGPLPAALPASLPGAADVSSAASTAASSALSSARSFAEGAASSAVERATDTVGGLRDAATSAASSVLGSAAGALGDPASQLGDLLEALEERVVAELERRGGRYAGAF